MATGHIVIQYSIVIVVFFFWSLTWKRFWFKTPPRRVALGFLSHHLSGSPVTDSPTGARFAHFWTLRFRVTLVKPFFVANLGGFGFPYLALRVWLAPRRPPYWILSLPIFVDIFIGFESSTHCLALVLQHISATFLVQFSWFSWIGTSICVIDCLVSAGVPNTWVLVFSLTLNWIIPGVLISNRL